MPQRDKLCLTITNILFTCSIAVRGGVLYTGITNALTTRVMEHRRAEDRKSLTAQYRAFRLVYYEEFGDVRAAIAPRKADQGVDSRQEECAGCVEKSAMARFDCRVGEEVRAGISDRWSHCKRGRKTRNKLACHGVCVSAHTVSS